MLIYIEDFVSNTEAIYRFKLEKEIVQLLQFMFHRKPHLFGLCNQFIISTALLGEAVKEPEKEEKLAAEAINSLSLSLSIYIYMYIYDYIYLVEKFDAYISIAYPQFETHG